MALFDGVFQGLEFRAHFEEELAGFLVCARPFGSRSVGGNGTVLSALLLEAGVFPGSQQRSAQLLSCHLLVGPGCLRKNISQNTHD